LPSAPGRWITYGSAYPRDYGGDWFAELVESEGLGLTVPPEDPDALADALDRLLSDPAMMKACRERAAAVRPSLRWSVVLEPLAAFAASRSGRPTCWRRQRHSNRQRHSSRQDHLSRWSNLSPLPRPSIAGSASSNWLVITTVRVSRPGGQARRLESGAPGAPGGVGKERAG